MKKITQEFRAKSLKDLEKEVFNLREEIGKSRLESKVREQKNTNLIHKKKKKLAVILTIISEKKETERLKI